MAKKCHLSSVAHCSRTLKMLQVRSFFVTEMKNYTFTKTQFFSLLFSIIYFISPVNNKLLEKITNIDIIAGDVFFEILYPPELEYTYRIKPARNFGTPFNSSFSLKRTKLVPMDPFDGCSAAVNSDMIEGNVAFVERGECSFLFKTIMAEEAGARAIIITEGATSSKTDHLSDDYIEMIADKTDDDATIPAGFLLGRSGSYILKILKKLHLPYALINLPVNMTFVPIQKMNQPPWIGW